MAQQVRPDDARLNWQGAISFDDTDQWRMPWRIPFDDRSLFPPDAMRDRAAMPAGVRISCHSDTQVLAGSVEIPVPLADEASGIDLYCDGHFQGSLPLEGQSSFRFEGLPAGEKLIELWLPQHGEFRLRGLEFSDGASIAPYEDTRPKWITYGSSITHCRTAESPSFTWPAVAARQSDYNLTCLGYGGNCHLEPMVARMIRGLPADFLSIKVGINVHNSGSMNTRTFQAAIIGFVHIVREKHPDTPFVVVSPIFSPPRETGPNAVGFTLVEMRQEVAEAVQAMKDRGDSNLHYVDGLDIFGPDLAHLLPDDLHPNAEGYKIMGRNFVEKVANKFFVSAQKAAVG
jgi:hypothetical protein